MEKKEEKTARSSTAGFFGYLISTVVSVIVVIYLGYHFINSLGTDLSTEYALQITENNLADFEAYIVKNETVVTASSDGEIGYSVSDGDKVRVGSEIAYIYGNGSTSGDISRNDIISIDKKIALLTESSKTEGLSASDTSAIDNRINSYYSTIRSSAEQGVYTNLPQRRDELLTLLNKRQIVTGTVESFDEIIEDLQNKRVPLTSASDSASESVLAPTSGFFFSEPDGYESIFTPEALKGITPDSYDALISRQPKAYGDDVIGKIVTDFTWQIITETTKDELRYYTKGTKYSIIFPYNNDIKLEMLLSDVISIDGNDRVLLLFSTSEAPEDFSYKRMQPIKVIKDSVTGYKVPISAVRLLDGRMGVYILVGSTVEFRYVDIIANFDGYYIAAPRDIENDPEYYTKLGLYDNIIVSGKDLFVGKMIS